jgi:hypothetical protein
MAVFSQTPSFLGFFYLLYPPTTYLTRGYPLGRRSSDLRFAQVVVAPPTLNPKYLTGTIHLGAAETGRLGKATRHHLSLIDHVVSIDVIRS